MKRTSEARGKAYDDVAKVSRHLKLDAEGEVRWDTLMNLYDAFCRDETSHRRKLDEEAEAFEPRSGCY